MYSDNRIKSNIEPVRASAVVVHPRSFPQRVVLYRNRKDEFVVHTEQLCSTKPDNEDSCAFEHYGFSDGQYFKFNYESLSGTVTEQMALKRAEDCFAVRMKDLGLGDGT